MNHFRKYLITIRRYNNEGLFWSFQVVLILLSLVGISVGFALDSLATPSFLINMIKGIISIVSGVTLFSFGHLFTSNRTDLKREKDRYYNPVRERFSHRQRVNFSIAIAAISLTLILLGSVESPTYTLKSILLIALLLSLLAFTRRLRSEFIKDIHEIPDIRDMEFESKRRKPRNK